MLKYFLLIITYINISWAQNSCPNQSNFKQATIFIDTNNSAPEIQVAKEAACKRGEKLIVIPEKWKEYDEFNRLIASKQTEIQQLDSKKSNISEYTLIKEKKLQELNDIFNRFNDYKDSKKLLRYQLEDALEKLNNEGIKLNTLIASGHNGGGHIGGLKGSIDSMELNSVFSKFPKQAAEVNSLYFLGCYTNTKNLVFHWKSIFPNSKLVAGYIGSAPASDKPAGHSYLNQLMLNEKKLTNSNNSNDINNSVQDLITSFPLLNSALYIEPICNTSDNLYMSIINNNREMGKLENISAFNECNEKKDEFNSSREILEKYYFGELDIPKDTANGELRRLYNFFRQNEHCKNFILNYPSLDTIFNLLFFDGIKESFAEYYADDLKKFEKEWYSLTKEEYESYTKAQIKITTDSLFALNNEIDLIKNHPEKYIEKLKTEIDKFNYDYNLFYNGNELARVLEKANLKLGEYPLYSQDNLSNPKDKEILQKYFSLKYQKDYFESRDNDIKYKKDDLLKSDLNLKSNMLPLLENTLKSQSINYAFNISDFDRFKNSFWIPNSKNIKNKTMKEIRENNHNLNKALLNSTLKPSTTSSLVWLNTISSTHLSSLQNNPFSWHSYDGVLPEKPKQEMPLSYYQNASNYMGSGLMGGLGSVNPFSSSGFQGGF